MNFLGFDLKSKVFLAPMAGVTDLPFRRVCSGMGAGFTVSEMVASNALLAGGGKTLRMLAGADEGPVSVQLVGGDPGRMAEAARRAADLGARIIDVNMGCPARKICATVSGSALMRDEALAGRIMEAVVRAADGVPVTLKMRTGWDSSDRNAPRMARMAQEAGVAALAVHGRTRADGYAGDAEYDTIALVKSTVSIPVIANGDVTTPEKARKVLDMTGADGVMVGRAALGRPWLFREIAVFLATGDRAPGPTAAERCEIALSHLSDIYSFHGRERGAGLARKHMAWYARGMEGGAAFRRGMNTMVTAEEQTRAAEEFFGSREAF